MTHFEQRWHLGEMPSEELASRSAVGILGASGSPSVKVQTSNSSVSLPGPSTLPSKTPISFISSHLIPHIPSQSTHLPRLSQLPLPSLMKLPYLTSILPSPNFHLLFKTAHCHVCPFHQNRDIPSNLIFDCRFLWCQCFCKAPFSSACFPYLLLPAIGVGMGSGVPSRIHLSRSASWEKGELTKIYLRITDQSKLKLWKYIFTVDFVLFQSFDSSYSGYGSPVPEPEPEPEPIFDRY